MSVVRSPVSSAVSAVAISVLGGGAVSIGAQLDNALEAEAADGDAVTQPDFTDLTSLFTSSGANPTPGDVVTQAVGTETFGGKSFEDWLAGEPALGADWTWTDNSSGSISIVESTGVVTLTSGAGDIRTSDIASPGRYYIEISNISLDSGTIRVQDQLATIIQFDQSNNGETLKFPVSLEGVDFRIRVTVGTPTGSFTITTKSIDSLWTGTATSLDEFNQGHPALTDNGGRGEELVDVSAGSLTDATVSGDEITFTTNGVYSRWIDSSISGEVGAEYELIVTVTNVVNVGNLRFRMGLTDAVSQSISEVGEYKATIRPDDYTQIRAETFGGTNFTGTFTISVRKVLTAFDGQPNLVTNDGWTPGTNTTLDGEVLNINSAGAGYSHQDVSAGDDEWFLILSYVTVTTGTATFNLGGNSTDTISSTGWVREYVRNGSNHDQLRFSPAGGFTGSVENTFLIKVPSSIPRLNVLNTDGSTDKLEWDLPARRNLLTHTEDFTQGIWGKSSATVSGGVITSTGASTSDFRQDVTRSTNGESVTWSLDIRRVSGLGTYQLIVEEWSGGFLASSANTSFVLTDDFQRVSISRTGTSAGTFWRCLLRRAGGGDAADGDQVEIRNPQLEIGSTATDYQRVGAALHDDMTVVMAIKTSDTNGMLFNSESTSHYWGIFANDGDGSNAVISSDSSTIGVDGADISPANRGAVHAEVADGEWHVVAIKGMDLSGRTTARLASYSGSGSYETAADYAFLSIFPTNSETLALAEAAAAEKIKIVDPDYALAA